MTTLFSATLEVAKLIPGNIVVEGAATGTGSTTTLADTAAWFVSPTTLPADDYFNGGTIWFKDMTTEASENKTGLITDYVSSTGVFTFSPALTVTTVKDDTYAASNRMYPRFILRQAVNHALGEVGGEDLQNTSLTSVADQMTYDLPTGVYNVMRVEVATSTSTPYNYVELNHWRELNDDIAFEEGHQLGTAGYKIRLTYRVPFAELTTDAGTIADLVDLNWIRWAGVAYCLRWKYGLTGKDEDVREFLKEALDDAEKMASRFRPKMRHLPRQHEHSAWSGGVTVDNIGEPDKVRL